MTAILDRKRVIGPKKDVQEVLNDIEVYENLIRYNPNREAAYLRAHQDLMKNLIEKPGV